MHPALNVRQMETSQLLPPFAKRSRTPPIISDYDYIRRGDGFGLLAISDLAIHRPLKRRFGVNTSCRWKHEWRQRQTRSTKYTKCGKMCWPPFDYANRKTLRTVISRMRGIRNIRLYIWQKSSRDRLRTMTQLLSTVYQWMLLIKQGQDLNRLSTIQNRGWMFSKTQHSSCPFTYGGRSDYNPALYRLVQTPFGIHCSRRQTTMDDLMRKILHYLIDNRWK